MVKMHYFSEIPVKQNVLGKEAEIAVLFAVTPYLLPPWPPKMN